VGYIFIAFMTLCIGCHLFFIFKGMTWQIILNFRRWKYRRDNPNLFPPKESLISKMSRSVR